MKRSVFTSCVSLAALFLSAACSRTPVSPATSDGIEMRTATAKPGSGPASSPHDLTFGPVPEGIDNDGHPSPGHIAGAGLVAGWITGASSAGNLKAQASGVFTMTISSVAPLPPGTSTGDPCTVDERAVLSAEGIVGSPITGKLTLSVDQAGSPSLGLPNMNWELAGVTVGLNTWRIVGQSSINYYPRMTNVEGGGLSLTLENGKIIFNRHPGGARRADLVVGCRVDVGFQMIPAS